MKNGARKTVQKKMFPGYVLLNMEMNDDTWYVVRNTRGVTGFVGPGSKPVPLTEAEMKPLGIKFEMYPSTLARATRSLWWPAPGKIRWELSRKLILTNRRRRSM